MKKHKKQQPNVYQMITRERYMYIQHPSNKAKFILYVDYTPNVALVVGYNCVFHPKGAITCVSAMHLRNKIT